MPPVISVVIPTHNRRDLLLRALHSALVQRDCSVEVVVVDDGSSDGTGEAVQALGDPRVRVLRNDRPVRVAAARNMGVQAAAGRWIALLDDDDLWSPDKLALQMAAVHATGRSWVYAGAVEVDREGRLLGGDPPLPPEDLLRWLPRQNVMPAGSSNVMIRADLFRQAGGFDLELRLMADWDFWLRLVPFGPPACVREPLVAYRMHGGQATVDPVGMLAEGRLIAERHGANLNSVRRWLAWSHLRRGERRLALRTYAGAALAGDLSCVARAAVAAFHPKPTAFKRPRPLADREWFKPAAAWLQFLAEECPR